jgi:hypothetical protein
MLADAIPGAELAVITGGSHFPMIEDADRLRSTVLPWVLRHDTGATWRSAPEGQDVVEVESGDATSPASPPPMPYRSTFGHSPIRRP